MIIALCLNSKSIETMVPGDLGAYERWPGSGFIGELKQLCADVGIECLSGETVLGWIHTKRADAKDVYVLQEESSELGEILIELGAKPGFLFCLESPLYTRQFYADLKRISAPFGNRTMCFGKDRVHFPSYGVNELMEPKPWLERKQYGWVISNKFVPTDDPRSLHPYRDTVLSYFINHGMDVAGQGWHPAREIGNKREFLRDYQFTFCIENYELDGYVTEKLIHALVAGVIPIYVGAPDVNELVPSELYFNPSRDMPMEELHGFLKSIDASQAKHMIQMGHDWLKSTDGMAFSYPAIAKSVLAAIKTA